MFAHLHLLPKTSLTGLKVSTRSQWADSVWYMDPDKPGQEVHKWSLRWDIEMDDGMLLTDPQWAVLLEDVKKFVWSLFSDSRSGPVLATSNCPLIRHGLSKILPWMAKNSYKNFAELDVDASWEFYQSLVDGLRDKHGEELKASTIEPSLRIWALLYRQTDALIEAGVPSLPGEPFDGETPNALADKVATAANGWIEPFPDEVALPLLGSAFRMLGEPAKDIIKLQEGYLLERQKPKKRGFSSSEVLRNFHFSTLPGESSSWRQPIGEHPDLSWETKEPITSELAVLRSLIYDLTGACLTVVQGTTGMRISELACLRGGVDLSTGLPCCVSIKPSKSGLNEIFYIRSQTIKIHEGSEMEWVLGLRPAGSQIEPPAVLALRTLDALFKPWRELSGLPQLICQLGAAMALPKTAEGVTAVDTVMLRTMIKSFAWRQGSLSSLPDLIKTSTGLVDISSYKTGEGIKPHQWRKTFALYVLRTDSKMLPAISQHFKHLSLAMTEQGYIGNDPELLDAIESVRRQRTVQFFLEQSQGKVAIAGGMAELVSEHRDYLASIAGSGELEDKKKNIEAWVIENDLRIWFADHGKCLLALKPGESKCHKSAGTDPWFKPAPNIPQRHTQQCMGCKCLAIDGEHLPFWKERLKANEDVLAAAGEDTRGEYRVARERVRQAKSVIRILDATNFSKESK